MVKEIGRALGSKEKRARKCGRVPEGNGREKRSSEGSERKRNGPGSEQILDNRNESEGMRDRKRERKIKGA